MIAGGPRLVSQSGASPSAPLLAGFECFQRHTG
jgi:hypothetical protein